jgi:hypothetical protein
MMTVSEKLAKARQTKADRKAQGIKSYKRTPIQVWEEDKLSLRKSINAKCYDCCCGQAEEVKGCAATSCPLWSVRPYQEK